MTANQQAKLTIIGLGLIGGSVAMRARLLSYDICAFDNDHAVLKQARADGVIQIAAMEANTAVRDADIILFALPIAALACCLADLKGCLPKQALLMDVASVKQPVQACLEEAYPELLGQWVMAHPMCGSQHSGYAHATANLLEHRNVILTSLTGENVQLARARAFWGALGMHVTELGATEHDKIIGLLSHLPHALAFSYLREVESALSAEAIDAFHGTGFRDFTRIGRAHPTLWADILLANKANLCEQIQAVQHRLATLQMLLQHEDEVGLQAFMTRCE